MRVIEIIYHALDEQLPPTTKSVPEIDDCGSLWNLLLRSLLNDPCHLDDAGDFHLLHRLSALLRTSTRRQGGQHNTQHTDDQERTPPLHGNSSLFFYVPDQPHHNIHENNALTK